MDHFKHGISIIFCVYILCVYFVGGGWLPLCHRPNIRIKWKQYNLVVFRGRIIVYIIYRAFRKAASAKKIQENGNNNKILKKTSYNGNSAFSTQVNFIPLRTAHRAVFQQYALV